VRTFQALMRVQPHPLVVGVERGDVNPSAVAGLWNDRSAGLLLYRDEWRAEGAGEEPPPGTSRAFTPVAMNLPAPTPQREPALGVLLDSGDAGVARSTTPTEALTEIRTYAARLQETARVFGAGDVPSVLLALTAEANDAAQALDAAEEKLRVVYETLARLGRVMALPRDEAPAAVIERWCRHEFPLLDLAADSGNANSTDTAQASNAESLARQAREGWAAVCARRPHAEAARRWAVAICVALHDQGHEPRPDPRNPGLGVCPRCGGREPLVALPTGATPATDELAAAPKSRRHSPSAFLLD
jgi:hypothetical protein